MPTFSVTNPFPVFTDLKGEPLENGKIFIGVVNLNPETNPVSVFFDEALSIPAAQPIRTIGGYPSRDGTPSDLFVSDSAFSITVRDKNDEFIFSKLDSTFGLIINSTVVNLEFVTDIATFDLTGIDRAECNFRDINKKEGGGGIFVQVVSGTPDGGKIFTDSVGNLFERQSDGPADFIWYGAVGDDITDDTAIIVNSQAALVGQDIHLSKGLYVIDVTSASVTLTSNLIFDEGAIIVVKRTSGTNRLDLRGGLRASPTQHFDLSNITANKVAWDAIFTPDGSQFPITFGFGTTTYNQFGRVPVKLIPQYFGADADPTVNNDLAVQICFDMHKPTELITNLSVNQVTLRGNELVIDFNNFKLLGIATTDTSSVLEIKCGFSVLRNLRADSQKDQFYQCAMHWYTNDLMQFFPGHNKFFGVFCENSYIGLVIGGLPSQTVFAAQDTVVTSPLATDAPLSESMIVGFDTNACLQAVFANQPNGKVDFTGGIMITSTIAGFSAPAAGRDTLPLADYSTLGTAHPGTEINLRNVGLTNTDSSGTVPVITVQGGRITTDGGAFETATHIRMKAHTGTYAANGSANAGDTFFASSFLYISSPTNFGWNLPNASPKVIVEDTAVGIIIISDAQPALTSGLATNAPFFMVTDTFAGLDGQATITEIDATGPNLINPFMSVRLDNVIFKDQPTKTSANVLSGISRGLSNFQASQCGSVSTLALDIIPPADDPLKTSETGGVFQASGPRMPLAGQIDPTGINVAASVPTATTDGGWTVTLTGTASVGRIVPTLGPVVVGESIINATPSRIDNSIRLTGGTGEATMESPLIPCEPSRAYFLSNYLRTNAGAPSGNLFILRIRSFDFDGNLLSDDNAVLAAENQLSGDWKHNVSMASTNKNATQMKLFINAQPSATFDITDIKIL